MSVEKGKNPLIDLVRVHDGCKWTLRAMTDEELENSTTKLDYAPRYCLEIGGAYIWASSEELDEFLEWFASKSSENKS